MTEKSSPEPVYGITDTEMVKVDFDGVPFKQVVYWAKRANDFHGLGGFVVLKSSEQSYHVVFDRAVSWSENMHVLAWLALLSHLSKLTKYLIMQCIKESSTLRVSAKGRKPAPRVVFRYESQKGQVREYLTFRRTIKRAVKKARVEGKEYLVKEAVKMLVRWIISVCCNEGT